ncbi:hypothetical protein Sjap_011382 [Stephania japonica]|uniref:Uncharacterized protein n=1 Tax=Stephania japonica TaxID=461633 RepID=A0AAP0JCA9_9MAGN
MSESCLNSCGVFSAGTTNSGCFLLTVKTREEDDVVDCVDAIICLQIFVVMGIST